jgi:hypothetical protein
MTTQCICTTNAICPDQNYEQTKANQDNKNSVWAALGRLTGTIGNYAVEVYRYNNDPQPVFANGGTRVLIRPGRIDLV